MTGVRPARGRRTLLSVALLACGIVVVSCGKDGPAGDSPEVTSDVSTEIANPASQYCIDQGGTLEMVDEPSGQVGYCRFPDGTRVEEWEFFRSANG